MDNNYLMNIVEQLRAKYFPEETLETKASK